MRELKLKYFIELASNIGSKARTEAQALEQSQRAMQAAVDKTSGAVGRLDAAFVRFSANTATERQVGYMRRLGAGIDQVASKMRGLAALTAKGLEKAPAALAGATAGFYTAKTLLDKPMDYDMRLRTATATAYAGASADELEVMRRELSVKIDESMRQAKGVTRDQTLGAFELLVGSGSFTVEESKTLLPAIMRTSMASSSNANDLVAASEKMKVNFGLTPDKIPLALSKLMRAGQAGGFEIKDSAKWMGPLAEYFKDYKGMSGVEAMATMLQQVRSTAGTNDEAANNLRNFMQKMKSDGTVKDFKKQGIDLTKEMALGAVKGQTPVDTYMAQLDKVMAQQDPDGKAQEAMRSADKSLSPKEKKERYEAVAAIYKRAGISKIINDLQEMGGYSGLAGTKKYGLNVLASVQAETGGAVQTGYAFRSAGTGARAIAAGQEVDIAAAHAFEGKSGFLNQALDKFTDLAQSFPNVATAAVGAASALGVLAAATTIFSALIYKNAGGAGPFGGPGGGLPKVPGSPGTYPILDGAAPAAAGGLGALGVGLGVASGGAMASYGAANIVAANKGLRDGLVGNMFGGDASFVAAILSASDLPADNHRGKGFNDPRLLSLTTPSIADQTLALGKTTEIKLGEGKLQIDVRVTNEGLVTATPNVLQPLPLIRINPGATNPGGF